MNISPHFSFSPNTLSVRLLQPLAWFLGVLCMSDQPACGHVTKAFATGCIGSNLDCPSARGICVHICLTVDGEETDPRRISPLNALELMSIILQEDSDAAFHTTARNESCVNCYLKMDGISLIGLSLVNNGVLFKLKVLHAEKQRRIINFFTFRNCLAALGFLKLRMSLSSLS